MVLLQTLSDLSTELFIYITLRKEREKTKKRDKHKNKTKECLPITRREKSPEIQIHPPVRVVEKTFESHL